MVGLLAVAFASKSQQPNQRGCLPFKATAKSSFCLVQTRKHLDPLLSLAFGSKNYPPATGYVDTDSFSFCRSFLRSSMIRQLQRRSYPVALPYSAHPPVAHPGRPRATRRRRELRPWESSAARPAGARSAQRASSAARASRLRNPRAPRCPSSLSTLPFGDPSARARPRDAAGATCSPEGVLSRAGAAGTRSAPRASLAARQPPAQALPLRCPSSLSALPSDDPPP